VLYHRFQDIYSEQVPALLLYQSIYTFCVDRKVRNVQIAPMLDASGRFRNVSDWEIAAQRVRLDDWNDQVGDTFDKQGYP
jgi:peptide/nickel transport system substrate-binding protein